MDGAEIDELDSFHELGVYAARRASSGRSWKIARVRLKKAKVKQRVRRVENSIKGASMVLYGFVSFVHLVLSVGVDKCSSSSRAAQRA